METNNNLAAAESEEFDEENLRLEVTWAVIILLAFAMVLGTILWVHHIDDARFRYQWKETVRAQAAFDKRTEVSEIDRAYRVGFADGMKGTPTK